MKRETRYTKDLTLVRRQLFEQREYERELLMRVAGICITERYNNPELDRDYLASLQDRLHEKAKKT